MSSKLKQLINDAFCESIKNKFKDCGYDYYTGPISSAQLLGAVFRLTSGVLPSDSKDFVDRPLQIIGKVQLKARLKGVGIKGAMLHIVKSELSFDNSENIVIWKITELPDIISFDSGQVNILELANFTIAAGPNTLICSKEKM